MKSAITIGVATGNIMKLQAAQKAFKRYFNTVDVVMLDVPSEVSRQPTNVEIMQGALNRVRNARKSITQRKYDFFVGCEGGMFYQFGKWFNVQVVYIEDEFGNKSWGFSQAFLVPKRHVASAIATSIAEVLDSIFDGKGGISMLTHGAVTREQLVEQATIMALIEFINEEKW